MNSLTQRDMARRDLTRRDLTRRELLSRGAAAAALAALPLGAQALGGCSRAEPAENKSPGAVAGRRRPNILFVFSDSHRASAMSCAGAGAEPVSTPQLDAFARSGLHLTSAVSSMPLCRPYRAGLMSGAFSHHTGLLTNNTNPLNFGVGSGGQWEPQRLGLPRLAESFRSAGYWCGYVGKWHLGAVALDPGDPRRLGFDDHWTVAARTPRDVKELSAHDYWNWRYETGADSGFEGGGRFRAEMETDLVLEQLAERARHPEQPFLLMLSWGPPHDPFTPPEEFVPEGRLELPPNVPAGEATQIARQMLPQYYGLVRAIDVQFGRILAALDAAGLAQDTLVVYTSDHGMMLGSHGNQGKEQPYAESTGVPFLLRWPAGLTGGRVLDLPFGTPDILPTLCGLAGLPAPGGVDGADLAGALRGEPGAKIPEAALLQCLESRMIPSPGWRGVRTSRHLYARLRDRAWLLYDLVDDPWELNDLSATQPALRAQLDEQLVALMAAAGDSWEA
ncbi:MAG: sulfatase-like hydrolase/transferase [Planctomycetota bacterium]